MEYITQLHHKYIPYKEQRETKNIIWSNAVTVTH